MMCPNCWDRRTGVMITKDKKCPRPECKGIKFIEDFEKPEKDSPLTKKRGW